MATDAERRSVLEQQIAQALATGARLESKTDYTAVVVRGKKVNHVLHAILSLLTAGIWLIVWLVLVLSNKQQRMVISVDEDGGIHSTLATA